MTKDTGGSAFPGLHPLKECRYNDPAMSGGVLGELENLENLAKDLENLVKESYLVALAMLKAREQ
jgi:hypothetical protein